MGKVTRSFFDRAIRKSLGSPDGNVLVGPKLGFDNAIIRVDDERVMIATTDPVSVIPSLGPETSAWLSVHLVASDYATSSKSPPYATFEYNLPPEMSDDDRERYLGAIGEECGKLGISIVGGHTGTYPGAGFTVVGGGTMFGLCGRGEYLDPSMSRPGDKVLMTKGAAIEATATLAGSFPGYTASKIGRRLAEEAAAWTRLCSTVKDALTASSVGIHSEGVTAMHDATEGGVLGALGEMAAASQKRFDVRTQDIHVSEPAAALCRAYQIDPLISLSEGTLLITCARETAEAITRKLRRNGVPTFEIGSVSDGEGLWLSGGRGRPTKFSARRDPYWGAYSRSTAGGLT